jgi:Tetratricopeptide repeat
VFARSCAARPGPSSTGSRLGDLDEAEAMHRRALAIRERLEGAQHPELAVPISNLATTLLAAGRAIEAEPLARRALALAEGALEPDHPNLEALRANLRAAEATARKPSGVA